MNDFEEIESLNLIGKWERRICPRVFGRLIIVPPLIPNEPILVWKFVFHHFSAVYCAAPIWRGKYEKSKFYKINFRGVKMTAEFQSQLRHKKVVEGQ